MSLIEFGFIFQTEKIIIFSNLKDNIVYNSSYDLDSVPILDWSISESYNDELREIVLKNHLLTIVKCLIKNDHVYCYAIIKHNSSKKFKKKLEKFINLLENKEDFDSIDDLKGFCFEYLIKESLIHR
jgi:hypothetical protein